MVIDEILKISQGLLTPVIGIIATYIAWQQWKTNKNKLRLDKYEKMLQVYKEVVRYISVGIRDANYDDNELMTFRSKVTEADFLFGDEVSKYIDELHQRSVSLSRWNKEYRDHSQSKPVGYDHKNVVDEMHKELAWVSSQLEPARNIFKKYLDISR
ncbi:MAG: hypothetical protein AB7P14_04385 [Blastocatellales bacterium]